MIFQNKGLLSAHVERFSVSHMHDFLLYLGHPDAHAGLRDAGDELGLVTPHGDRVLHLPAHRVQDLTIIIVGNVLHTPSPPASLSLFVRTE